MLMAMLIIAPSLSQAQTTATKTTKQTKSQRAKATKTKTATQTVAPATPPATTSKPTTKPPKTVTKAAPSTAAAGNDKVIGKEDKGRTIYEGKRGGHYYINSNGNKTYIKKN
jgi:colicin import membrane protein